MADSSAFSLFFMPAVVIGTIGVLVLLLRWGFSGGPSRSLVARRPVAGAPSEYGLLVSVAAPNTYIEGEVIRRRLEDHGLRASLVITNDGPRVMVWPEDEQRARDLLS